MKLLVPLYIYPTRDGELGEIGRDNGQERGERGKEGNNENFLKLKSCGPCVSVLPRPLPLFNTTAVREKSVVHHQKACALFRAQSIPRFQETEHARRACHASLCWRPLRRST